MDPTFADAIILDALSHDPERVRDAIRQGSPRFCGERPLLSRRGHGRRWRAAWRTGGAPLAPPLVSGLRASKGAPWCLGCFAATVCGGLRRLCPALGKDRLQNHSDTRLKPLLIVICHQALYGTAAAIEPWSLRSPAGGFSDPERLL